MSAQTSPPTLKLAATAPVPVEEAVCPHTAVNALALVAREHGVDVLVDQLLHQFAVGNHEVHDRELTAMAKSVGLAASAVRLDFDRLVNLGAAYPAILRLKDGSCMIASAAGKVGEVPAVLLRDPRVAADEVVPVDERRLSRVWDGAALLVKPSFRAGEADAKPFGFATFLDEARRHRRLFADVALCAAILSLLSLAPAIFFQLIIDRVLLHHSQSTLWVLVIGISIVLLFEGIFLYLRSYLLLFASAKIDASVNMAIFAKVLALPMTYFEKTATGVLVKNLQQPEKVRNFLTGQLFSTILDALSLVVLIPVMFLYSPVLASMVLGFTLVLCLIVGLAMPVLRRRMMDVYSAEASLQAFLVENVQGMRTVKSLALDGRRRKEWSQRLASTIDLRLSLMKLATLVGSLVQPLQKLMAVAVIAVGAQLVFDHAIQVGALIAFNIISLRVVQPLIQIAGLAQQFQEALISVRMLGSVMNQPAEAGRGRRGARPRIKGAIDFQGVRFRYAPDMPPALDSVTFTITEGTIFGIMGRSGSGKTTVTRLLQGLHRPQDGLIRLDGMDLREIDLDWARANIGVVLQDNFLFQGTIRDNIAQGKPGATAEEVLRAARLAGADEFIERLPRGFDTMIEEGSANLSGGQRQRLAIARALLPDPPVLILDEATSALDPESEAILQSNLLSIAQGRTLIIISHRLSSLVPSDAIMVLDRGRVEDVGKHAELLDRCEIYQRLWAQQNHMV